MIANRSLYITPDGQVVEKADHQPGSTLLVAGGATLDRPAVRAAVAKAGGPPEADAGVLTRAEELLARPAPSPAARDAGAPSSLSYAPRTLYLTDDGQVVDDAGLADAGRPGRLLVAQGGTLDETAVGRIGGEAYPDLVDRVKAALENPEPGTGNPEPGTDEPVLGREAAGPAVEGATRPPADPPADPEAEPEDATGRRGRGRKQGHTPSDVT